MGYFRYTWTPKIRKIMLPNLYKESKMPLVYMLLCPGSHQVPSSTLQALALHTHGAQLVACCFGLPGFEAWSIRGSHAAAFRPQQLLGLVEDPGPKQQTVLNAACPESQPRPVGGIQEVDPP